MSRSGRATAFMTMWARGQRGEHDPGHKTWGADDCAACVAEEYDPWEALVHAAEIMGWIAPDPVVSGDTPKQAEGAANE